MFFERRVALRVRPTAVEPIEVQVVAPGRLEVAQAIDISESGMGVQLEAAAGSERIGAEVELIIALPGAGSIYAKGRVQRAWTEKGAHLMGIEFTALAAKTLDAIRTYITRRSQHLSTKMRIGG